MADLMAGLLKGIEDLLANPNKPCGECKMRSDHAGRSTKYGWKDEIYLTKGLKYCVWKPIPEDQVEGHLIDFVNLWCAGDVRMATDVFPIIRNVLLMMPVGTSNELLLKDVFDSAIQTAQTPPPVDSPYRSTHLQKIYVADVRELDSMDTVKRLSFLEWLSKRFILLRTLRKKTLEDQSFLKLYTRVSQELRLVLGFCALILIRLMITNEHKIKEYVQHGGTTAFKSLFPEVGLTVRLAPPEWRSSQLAAKAFKDHRNGLTKNLLQLVIFQYVKSSTNPDASSRLAKQILEEGCLEAMQGNGMGLVTMFYDVVRIYPHIDDRRLLKIVGTDPELDGESCKRLVKFMDVYSRGDKPQVSWKWARILSPDYFSDLNVRRNRTFCQKLALLLVPTNPHIFQHKDMRPVFRDECFGPCYNSQSNAVGKKWAESTSTSLREINDKAKVCPQL